jgi:hypothetical protein
VKDLFTMYDNITENVSNTRFLSLLNFKDCGIDSRGYFVLKDFLRFLSLVEMIYKYLDSFTVILLLTLEPLAPGTLDPF